MRYSRLFGQTVRGIPAEAVAISHQLLYRGGFIRQISTGRYAFTPLGFKVAERLMAVIDEEMRRIDCQRVAVPTLQPIEIWKATNRDQAFGGEMLIVEDHHGATFAIGATAEGVMVELVKKFRPSYKDLPILIYQFSQKFRDDKRPRGGLLRVREFMMKDAYSFCRTEAQALEVYQRFFEAYLKIAKSLDLEVIPVQADSGALGGDYNHEFIVPSAAGESRIFVCDRCGYAASAERAEFKREDLTPGEPEKPLLTVDQPEWVRTMEDNCKFYGEPLYRYLKNVVYKTPDNRIIVATIRGDQEVNEAKLARALAADSVTPALDEELAAVGLLPGSVPSWGFPGVCFVGDQGLAKVKNFIGGQKGPTTDVRNVNYGRDLNYPALADIASARDGDSCSSCSEGKLREKQGIEFGHCFKQDLFYTGPQQGFFVDEDGVEKPLWMGAYGIGVERAIATVVETHHDDQGIVWPEAIAPFRVHLLNLNMEDTKVTSQAEDLYRELASGGTDVLYDDRECSAGVKLADADLLGIPWRVIVSRKSLASGVFEVKGRSSGELRSLGSGELLEFLKPAKGS